MTTGSALIGRTLGGRFRVTGFIGEGAMACVYRGVQEGEPRDVAIKVMHPHLSSDRTFVGRFRREAKAAAQISHPNSVKILDTGVDEKLLYIAMELLAGQDLFEVLSAEHRLSEARAAKILVQVCAALAAAHECGIVHRDLKPENVMLVGDAAARGAAERVKVLDFGIAKILERESMEVDGVPHSSNSLTALTNVGMVVGTPAYMSPEQCRGEAVDARSDVYACGILLYQLVTGRLPFAGSNAMDYAVKHVRTVPTPPREVTPGMHPALEALVLKALAKWPDLRHQSALALSAELERLAPELASTPFEDKRISVGPLKLSSSGGAVRHVTPEPVTARRQDTPTREVYRTLPSERRLLDSVRPSRADTLEAQAADKVKTLPIPPRVDDLAPARSPDVTVTMRADVPPETAPKARPASEPPPSSFHVFAHEPTTDDDDATRPNRLPAPDEAPTPLSRPLSAKPPEAAAAPAAPAAPVAYDEPATPQRSPPPRAHPDPEKQRKKAALARQRAEEEARAWLIVPAALALGLALGTALYFLMR